MQLTPEQEQRCRDMIGACEAALAGREWEAVVVDHTGESPVARWMAPAVGRCPLDYWHARSKPAPQYRPWTAEEVLAWMRGRDSWKIHHKIIKKTSGIVSVSPKLVTVEDSAGGETAMTFGELLEHWHQPNSQPCGAEVAQ